MQRGIILAHSGLGATLQYGCFMPSDWIAHRGSSLCGLRRSNFPWSDMRISPQNLIKAAVYLKDYEI